MTDVDVGSLKRDDKFFVDIGESVWLMDNHKWALYVWEVFRQKAGSGRYTLVHVDYHWDGVYDFYCDSGKEQELLSANLDQLYALIEAEEWIRYDSFIAPAVARRMFDSLHFYCLEDDESDVAIDEKLLASTRTDQIIHQTPDSLVSLKTSRPLIFDLCLDLFNRSDQFQEGGLWTDKEILGFLDMICTRSYLT